MSDAADITAERFGRLKVILLATLDCPDAEQGAFLDQACDGDEELRREAESLLRHRERPAQS